jgi:hypothetical protein
MACRLARPAARDLRLWVLLGTAAILAWWVPRGSAHAGTVGVTWAGGVSRILENRCLGCHGPSGSARPRLDEYDRARLASQAIKQAVLSRHMPGWYAASGFGEFGNDPTPTPHEIEMLAQWADGRAPRGDLLPISGGGIASTDAPPEAVLRVSRKYRVDEPVHTFQLETGFQNDRWMRGWKFEAGNPSLITGAVFSLPSGRRLGTWTPGDNETLLPDGLAYRLPARSPVLLTVYYRHTDGPAVDASGVALYLGRPPRREVQQMVLPCGTSRLPRSIDALAVRPVPGSAGHSLTILARRPDHVAEALAWFRDYPADHTQTYWFRDAVPLARGTTIEVGGRDATCTAELEYVVTGEPIVYPAPHPAPLSDAPVSDYWCPMHADVRTTAPGACARCGMPLVPMKARVEGQYALDASLVPSTLRPGQRGTLRLVVREPGSDTPVRRFVPLHERPFHLFVVSEDLQEFSHVHPDSQPDGSLTLPITLTRGGTYYVYADFLPAGGTPQMIRRPLVAGAAGRGFAERRPRVLGPDPAEQSDASVRVQMQLASGNPIAGNPSLISFTIADRASGLPVTDLQPYLGAWGHMFIVSSDLTDAVHSHPTTPLTAVGGPTIFFSQRFPHPGSYRLWVQFQRNGHLSTLSFTVAVSDGVAPTTF